MFQSFLLINKSMDYFIREYFWYITTNLGGCQGFFDNPVLLVLENLPSPKPCQNAIVIKLGPPLPINGVDSYNSHSCKLQVSDSTLSNLVGKNNLLLGGTKNQSVTESFIYA